VSLRPARLLAVATGAFGVGFSALAVLQQRAFWTGRFDLGNLTQAVWSTAHGHPLSMTDLQGRQISRLGAHFDPLVAVLAPAWLVWPHPSLLLVVQAIGVGLGAPAVYLLASKHLESEWAGLGFALAYLLYPPTQWLVLDDFHPVAFAAPLLLWGFWFLDGDRLVAFAAVAVPAALTKEQVGLVVAAIGVWYAFRPGRRRQGIAIALAGAAVSVVALLVIIPHFAPAGSSPFASRYDRVGGSPSGIVRTAVTDPATIAREATKPSDRGYVVNLLLPLLALPLVSPGTALTAAPEIGLNLLSSTRTQTSIHFHYTAAAIPGLFAAAIFGAARLRRRSRLVRRLLPRLLVIAGLIAGYALGPMPLWRLVPGGSTLATREHVVSAHARAAARVISVIPKGEPVSATNALGAHLSARRRILSFPLTRGVTWVAVDTTRPSYLDEAAAPTKFAEALAAIEQRGTFRLVRAEDGVRVYRLRRG